MTTRLDWRSISAVAAGALLGLLLASWLQTGEALPLPPTCVLWSRGGSLRVCTGWAE